MISLIMISDLGLNLSKDNHIIFDLEAHKKRILELTKDKIVCVGFSFYASNGFKPVDWAKKTLVLCPDGVASQNKSCEFFHSLKDLVAYLKILKEDVYVLGGYKTFTSLYPYANYIYLTQVFERVKDGHNFFGNLLDLYTDASVSSASEVFEENGLKYSFVTYERIAR